MDEFSQSASEYDDFDSGESESSALNGAVYEPSGNNIYDEVYEPSGNNIYDEVYEPSGVSYILSFRIEAPLRRILVHIVLGGCFASLNGGVVFLILSWFVRNSLQKQITFLQDYYQPAAVPSALTTAGFIVLGASLVGLKAGVDAVLLSAKSATDACRTASKTLTVFWVCAIIATIAILVAACICFTEVRSLTEGMAKGILAAMHKYSNESAIKTQIDRLQMEHQCCGVNGYKDWYEVAWIDTKYLDFKSDPEMKKHLKNGKYYGQNVPFSCCRLDAVRPCVSVHVEDAKYHSKYSYPKDLTLYEVGCLRKVTDNLGGTVFRSVGGFVFVCFFIWIFLTLIGRYLQTSVARMAVGKRPVGWLIPIKSPKKSYSSTKIKQEEYSD